MRSNARRAMDGDFRDAVHVMARVGKMWGVRRSVRRVGRGRGWIDFSAEDDGD